MGTAYRKIGDIQGNSYFANLGDAPGALASYQKALQLRYAVETLVAAPPDDRAGLADGLETVEELLGTLATWHATTRDKLFYAAQRVRSART